MPTSRIAAFKEKAAIFVRSDVRLPWALCRLLGLPALPKMTELMDAFCNSSEAAKLRLEQAVSEPEPVPAGCGSDSGYFTSFQPAVVLV